MDFIPIDFALLFHKHSLMRSIEVLTEKPPYLQPKILKISSYIEDGSQNLRLINVSYTTKNVIITKVGKLKILVHIFYQLIGQHLRVKIWLQSYQIAFPPVANFGNHPLNQLFGSFRITRVQCVEHTLHSKD